ncbi:hypothetical protein JMN32_05395 [Fulvivirga sp. 29W222]|uniref:Uncharacterized protein n=1 Tax=Fulvivirga marina TaxID=2494733 RepID=A0A937FWE0_9BACT|nr:hypothetical protein [Fulvivirga marina]MBL6445733.1 hypothetical protein [Fulvivirga marina]
MGLFGLRKCFVDEEVPCRFQFGLNVELKIDAFEEYIEMTEKLINIQVKNKLLEIKKEFSDGLGDDVDMVDYSIKKTLNHCITAQP